MSAVADQLLHPLRSQGSLISYTGDTSSLLITEKDKKKQIKEEIKRRMERRYVKYFKHWKDYEMLTCILSMIGLILAMVEVYALFSNISIVRVELRLPVEDSRIHH